MNFQEIHAQKVTKALNQMIEFTVRTTAKPIIKGEITQGKLKWRGLKLVMAGSPFNRQYWIEQRGERISVILNITIQ